MIHSFIQKLQSNIGKTYPVVARRSAQSYRVGKELYRKVSDNRFFYPVVYSLFFIVAFLHGWALLHARLGMHFTQDSYAYYLIGKNIFNGLGYTTYCARDFAVEPVWPVLSQSFPPLHPLLTGLVDVVTDLGVRSLSMVSLFYLAGTIVTMFFLGRGMDKKSWLFVFFAFIVVISTNKFYREELEAGRSIPGMALFFLLAMGCFLRTVDGTARNRKYEILTGVMLAAMLLQRFDQTLFTLAFLFCSFFVFKLRGLTTRQSLIRTGTIAGAFVIASFPWALRNIIHFGSPFASDNTGSTVTTFRGLYCCHFWLPGMEPPSLFTHPEMWLNQRLHFLSRNFNKIVNITHQMVYLVPVAVLAMWRTFSFRQWVFIFFAVVHFCTTLFTISITPYGDPRYFSLVHLNLTIVLAVVIGNAFHAGSTRVIRAIVQTAMVLFLLHITFSDANVRRFNADLLAGNIVPQTAAKKAASFQGMEAIVSKYVKADDVLSVKPNADGYTAFTGRRTIYWPSTIKRNRRGLAEWIQIWSVDYFLVPKSIVNRLRLQSFVVTNVNSRLLVDANAYLKSIGK